MAQPCTLLLVDDQPEVLRSLEMGFERTPHTVVTAAGGGEAIRILNDQDIDVVVTDLKMPDVDGTAVLRHAMTLDPPPSVIILTAFGTIESAVEALKSGAFHYCTKPINLKEIRAQVDKAAEVRSLVRENVELRRQINRKFGLEGFVGETAEMQRLFDQVRLIAPTKANVLILGESGTGKEVLARAIHQAGQRAKRPFVAVHCAALPETLLESELFGHEKGAFTGAVQRRPGRFEIADGGTLFLDEIGEIPLSMQVKLLRVLEEREFVRVGGTQAIKVDVRVIAATNADLAEEVAEGRFREDLYYRLKVVQLELPPLRHRRADIPLLTRYFLEQFAQENARPVPRITKAALDRLMGYNWPGNVRELRNVLENTFVFLRGDEIDVDDLPPQFREEKAVDQALRFPLGMRLDEVETQYLQQTLRMTDGNRTRAAELLGISRRTLQRRLKELGLEAG
jgi:DNA-binding NtrC family response regulator